MSGQELNDLYLRCLCLWREARGSSLPALAAINSVITNRMNDPHNRWPKSATGVILQPLQFSSFNASDPNSTKLPDPRHPQDWVAWCNCVLVAEAPLGGDNTDGATNYESEPPDKLPAWADPAKITTTIGPFRFYKL
ncbi:MAG: cell wall hydrolase [Thaumarchaeota archaeon]|nr:cell wall hydrolase [Nitrososphaerota archaeon]